MHLRRALLLFAIVLGLAAVASTISRPQNADDEPPPPTSTESSAPPTVSPGDGEGAPAEIAFDAAKPRAHALEVGRAATVTVAVEGPGSVGIPRLGLSANAEPLTPAHFDVLVGRPGRYELRFTPADGDEDRPAGTLVVESADAQDPPKRSEPSTRRTPSCPDSAQPGCRSAGGRVLYVERVDPDGDGDAHFVLASRQSITAPGISVIDVARHLRPQPLPDRGDWIAAAGPVYRGSYGQRQVEAIVLDVSR
jgi:hypothetical protein